MKTIFFITLFFIALVVRWLRWLAIVQQKEYRWDRIFVFCKSESGKAELRRLFPKKSDFSRSNLKRPRLTLRIMLIAIVSLSIWLGTISLVLMIFLRNFEQWWLILISVVILVGLSLVLAPIFIGLAVLPSTLLVTVRTRFILQSAQFLIKKHQPIIIGITGSYGKTATKQLLAKLLSSQYDLFVTPKSHNTCLSVAQSILRGYHGQSIVVIEYAAYTKGEIARLAKWFPPKVAVVTGLTTQHVGLFGSLEAIIEAKAELIKALPSEGEIWYTQNEPQVKRIVDLGLTLRRRQNLNTEKLRIYSYASSDQFNEFDPRLTDEGKLVVYILGKIVQTQLIGLHYVEAVMLSVCLARQMMVSEGNIVDAIQKFTPTEQFTRLIQLANGAKVIDDGGSSNPVGFYAILKLAESIEADRKILVTAGIVDLGKMSDGIHRALAEQARPIFSTIYYLGMDGRKEFEQKFGVDCLVSQEKIIAHLKQISRPKSLIILEGRIPAWFQNELT